MACKVPFSPKLLQINITPCNSFAGKFSKCDITTRANANELKLRTYSIDANSLIT